MRDVLFLAKMHEEWRLQSCINLLPSENVTSPQVRKILSSDFGHRYTLPLPRGVHGGHVENAYRGTRYMDEVEAMGEEVAREVFASEYATLKPLSGHLAGLVMLLSACKRGDLILTIDPSCGGYDGYSEGYLPEMLGLKVRYLPFVESHWNLDVERCAEQISKERPRLAILGASFILFPYEMAPLEEACQEAGTVLGYDASHVLGLIAGGEFQRPFEEGADIVVGSTHKSFFGPQGGIILTGDEDLFEKVQRNLTWRTIDNAHWNRVAALTQALMETKAFGSEYAREVVKNSQALARELERRSFPLRFGNMGFTRSHQLLIDAESLEKEFNLTRNEFAVALERSNIIVDAVGRLGTAEVTRMGATQETMASIAECIMRAVEGEDVSTDVLSVRKSLQMRYVFEETG